MRDYKKDLGLLIIALFITLVLVVGSICLGGKVLCDMWNWFVVPATNLNELSYAMATGIWVLVDGMFIANISNSFKGNITSDYDKTDGVRTVSSAIGKFLLLLATWGIGALIHCWM